MLLLLLAASTAQPPRLTFGAPGAKKATLLATCDDAVGPAITRLNPSALEHMPNAFETVNVHLLGVPNCLEVPPRIPCYDTDPSYPAFIDCQFSGSGGTQTTGPYAINTTEYGAYVVQCILPPESELLALVAHDDVARIHQVTISLVHQQTGISLDFDGLDGGNKLSLTVPAPPAPPLPPAPASPPIPPQPPSAPKNMYNQYLSKFNGWGVPAMSQECWNGDQAAYSNAKYKSSCRSAPKTLTIVQLDNGLIMGGYAGRPWSTSSSSYITCSDCFLFSITNNYKYPVTKTEHGMHGSSSYGPCFGGGHDFCLQGYKNGKGGYCNTGHSYACPSGLSGTACQEHLCGSYNNWMIVEMEVWVP